jgi:hypothetical protein
VRYSTTRAPRSASARTAVGALSGLAAALLAGGCGRGTAGPAAAATTGAPPAAAATAAASPSAGNADQCRYLTVDQVKQALRYGDTMQSAPDDTGGFDQCVYQASGNGFVRVNVSVHPGRTDLDNTKSLYTAPDCTSAGIGEDSLYCPKSDQGNLVFVKDGKSVNISVSNIQSLLQQQGTDSTQAALALARIVAGEV